MLRYMRWVMNAIMNFATLYFSLFFLSSNHQVPLDSNILLHYRTYQTTLPTWLIPHRWIYLSTYWQGQLLLSHFQAIADLIWCPAFGNITCFLQLPLRCWKWWLWMDWLTSYMGILATYRPVYHLICHHAESLQHTITGYYSRIPIHPHNTAPEPHPYNTA